MEKQSDNFTLLGVGIAGFVAVAMTPGKFDIWDTMIGIILCVFLGTYGAERLSTPGRKWAHAMVWGFCVLLVVGFPIDYKFFPKDINEQEVTLSTRDGVFLVSWVVLLLLRRFFTIDKSFRPRFRK